MKNRLHHSVNDTGGALHPSYSFYLGLIPPNSRCGESQPPTASQLHPSLENCLWLKGASGLPGNACEVMSSSLLPTDAAHSQ